MATRGIIARKTPEGWSGVYHHWDSYPSGLGQTLYRLYHGYFQRNLAAMLCVLIDEHRAGWSNINGVDFSKAPGWSEEQDRPCCYCHGGRNEPAQALITMQSDTLGAEYAYALDEGRRTMHVFAWWGDGEVFSWRQIAVVDLDGPEPEWGKVLSLQASIVNWSQD